MAENLIFVGDYQQILSCYKILPKYSYTLYLIKTGPYIWTAN